MGHRLQVIRIDASEVTTEVIQFEPVRDKATGQDFIAVAVSSGGSPLTADLETAITFALRSGPIPTVFRLLYLRPEPVFGCGARR
jgi:hypothetical protein